MLEVDDIHSYYGKSHILHGVSLEVNEGETVALLGRNGAGKTTTLRSIMGIVEPVDGKVTYERTDITHEPAQERVRRGIGYIPEDRRVFTALTVHENLRIAAHNDDHVRMIDEVYEMFPRLGERRNQDASALSGGEQQMLSIGRALVTEPAVLLIDEPTEGLMPTLVDKMEDFLLELSEQDTTVLLVEQNADVALNVSDRGYVMEKGKIQLEAFTDELRDDPTMYQEYLAV